MKKILFFMIMFFSLSMSAEEPKPRVAVFDPIIAPTAIENDQKRALQMILNDQKTSIREIITSSIVNSGKFQTVERSLLDKVFQEQNFSNSGVVDDNNAVEIGKLAGANKVVVSIISPAASKVSGLFRGGLSNYMLSIKIIDVQTANIDKQKIKKIKLNDYMDEISAVTDEMINGKNDQKIESGSDLKKRMSQEVLNKAASQKNTESEFELHLEPGYTPDNYAHKDNFIEVLLNGDIIGGGTLAGGFDIKIKEKKHKKYKLEIRPTSTHENGKTDNKSGKTQYKIDTSRQQYYEFIIQSQKKGKWTIYTVRLK